MESGIRPALELREVSKSFADNAKRRVAVIQNLSITIQRGEIVGVFGPSGCGKSTLLKLVSGILAPDLGEIHVLGDGTGFRRGSVAYVPQRTTLLAWKTLWDNALLGWRIIRPSREDDPDMIQRATMLFEHFGISTLAHHYPEHCSGGERQRVALIRALLTPASLLALDEPLAAIDHITRVRIYETLLEEVQNALGSPQQIAALIVSHDPEELLTFCDRILVMSRRPGSVVEDVQIEFARPRESDLKFRPEFVEMKRYLWSLLS